MRLKPRNVKRWMFACTQCGQCISACGTVNRNNPDGQLLRWVANDDARRNEARFSALSNVDEDAGGRPDMEEFIGKIWHNWVTRAAGNHYPQAAVKLAEVEKTAGILFRAFGGDPGLNVAAATSETHGARRRWLQRVAGSGERSPMPGAMPRRCACRRKSLPSRRNRSIATSTCGWPPSPPAMSRQTSPGSSATS